MKILWSSNAPWAASGYGQQTAMFAPRIRDLGHDVAINAVWGLQGAGSAWDGISIYPADGKWGNEMLPVYAANHGGGDPGQCLVITLHDVYVLDASRMRSLDLACWCPVDHDPIPDKVLALFRVSGARPIAMSRFGEDRLRGAGLDPLYVPHGVETSWFDGLDRDQARKQRKIPESAFVVGMVAANQGLNPPRKAFPQVFLAFKEFHRKHSDAMLYLHTDLLGPPSTGEAIGLNLVALAEACGIPLDAVGVSDQTLYRVGNYTVEELARTYSTFDVLANPSYGEGFGIPIVEAQAAGVPVIVTDHTAMPELCGAGWKVNGQPWWDPMLASWFKEPSVASIYEALEEAYDHAGGLRDQAREFAAGYDADRVFDTYWKPTLAALESPREIPALPGRKPKAKVAA